MTPDRRDRAGQGDAVIAERDERARRVEPSDDLTIDADTEHALGMGGIAVAHVPRADGERGSSIRPVDGPRE
jgi:hypothetical protein